MEQDLVEALDKGVQHSVNTALVKAIVPLKHHLNAYALQQGWIPASSTRPPTSGKKDTTPHAEDFARLSRASANDHAYTNTNESTDSTQGEQGDSSSHKDTDDEAHRPAKKARKEDHTESQPKLLTFDPKDIIHPNSTAWLPSQEVADYVQSHLRLPLIKMSGRDCVPNALGQIWQHMWQRPPRWILR